MLLFFVVISVFGDCNYTIPGQEPSPGECAGMVSRTEALRSAVRRYNLNCPISLTLHFHSYHIQCSFSYYYIKDMVPYFPDGDSSSEPLVCISITLRIIRSLFSVGSVFLVMED